MFKKSKNKLTTTACIIPMILGLMLLGLGQSAQAANFAGTYQVTQVNRYSVSAIDLATQQPVLLGFANNPQCFQIAFEAAQAGRRFRVNGTVWVQYGPRYYFYPASCSRE